MAIALTIVSPKIFIHWYWLILVNEPRGYAKTQNMMSILNSQSCKSAIAEYMELDLNIINPFLN